MKTFYPRTYTDVPASYPHPENTAYRVSIGDEEWNGTFVQVVKVQMVYDGNVAGRKSPSYPLGTDDWERVSDEIAKLTEKYAAQKQKMVFIPAKEAVVIPFIQRIELIKRIPYGKIVCEEDLDDYFKRAYKTDTFRFIETHHPVYDEKGEEIPYWRVVGKGGRVTMGSRFTFTREQKCERLAKEGVQTERFGTDLIRVIDFRHYLFYLESIPVVEIVSTCERHSNLVTQEQISDKLQQMKDAELSPLQRYEAMLNDPDLIRGIDTAYLENIAGGMFDFEPTSEKWLKTKDNVKKELERRNASKKS